MVKWSKYLLIATLIIFSHVQSSKATNMTASDWYLHMDVNALKQSVIGQKIAEEKSEEISRIKKVLGSELVDKVNYLTIQGGVSHSKPKIMLVQGDFVETALQQRLVKIGFELTEGLADKKIYSAKIKRLLLTVGEAVDKYDNLSQEEKKNLAKLDDAEELEKIVYASVSSANSLLISDSIETLKQWVENSPEQSAKQQTGVFEVVVDIENALLHGGVNIDNASEAINFESISAEKLSQVSVTYNEVSGEAQLQLGLKSSSTQTATQIKSVVQGLVALKMLSESDPVIVDLLSSIQFEQNAGDLVVILSGPIDSFKAIVQHVEQL